MQAVKGRLKTWKDERGFGFIRPESDGPDVYVHIRDFGPITRRPRVGDIIHYQPMRDASGRLRAADVRIDGVPSLAAPPPAREQRQAEGSRRRSRTGLALRAMLGVAPLAVVIALVSFRSERLDRFERQEPPARVAPSVPESPVPATGAVADAAYSCEPDKHSCPQMDSCAEAKFYLRHCPGTVMDGDGDGLPCEDQWCGH